jgi:hypothetical protein
MRDRVVGQLQQGRQHDAAQDRDAAQQRHRPVGQAPVPRPVDEIGAQGDAADDRRQGRRARECDEEGEEGVELVEQIESPVGGR